MDPYKLKTNTYRLGERPLPLLAAEYLGAAALDFEPPSPDSSPRSLLAGAWGYTELAIAEGIPGFMDTADEYVDSVAQRDDASPIVRSQAELLRAYSPLFRYRSERRHPYKHDKAQARARVARRIANYIDTEGYPKNYNSGHDRGEMAEDIALYLIDDSFPSSFREKESPSAAYNHDSHTWDGSVKVPVEVKLRQFSHIYDERIYRLYLGRYFHRVLESPDYEPIIANNEQFTWPTERLASDAAVAVVALAIVRQNEGKASNIEECLLSSLGTQLTNKIKRFGFRRGLKNLK